MLLWERGRDVTWPPCPEHSGRHPLRVDATSDVLTSDLKLPGVEPELRCRWVCPEGTFAVPLGSL